MDRNIHTHAAPEERNVSAINKSIRPHSAPTELESIFNRVVYKHWVPPGLRAVGTITPANRSLLRFLVGRLGKIRHALFPGEGLCQCTGVGKKHGRGLAGKLLKVSNQVGLVVIAAVSRHPGPA